MSPMTVEDALDVAHSNDRELHDLGYAWAERAREDALDVLACEVERLRATCATPRTGAWDRLMAEVNKGVTR